MAISSKLFPAVILLLLLASEMGPVQEVAAACQSALCKKCTGSCFDEEECSINCRNEGFDNGDCSGANYHCLCKKGCQRSS